MEAVKVVVTRCPIRPDLVGREYDLPITPTSRALHGGVLSTEQFLYYGCGRWRNANGTEVARVRYSLTGTQDSKGPVEAGTVPTTYPDGNPKSVQGAKKFSLRYIPLPAQVEMCRALEDGDKKYGPANWRETGVAASVYVDAALRHIMQFYDGGQDNADDSGVHNLGHAMACLAIIVDAQYNGTLIDDRPAPCKDTDALLLRSKE